jgi:hypothetical protein
MTIAEIVLLVAGGVAIYALLRPLQRWLEAYLLRTFVHRRRRSRPPLIDVTHFTSHSVHQKDDDEHRA